MSFVIFSREKYFKSFFITVINPTAYWPMMFNTGCISELGDIATQLIDERLSLFSFIRVC